MRANLAWFPDVLSDVEETYKDEFAAVAKPILLALRKEDPVPAGSDPKVVLHVACRVLRGVRLEQLRLDAARMETEELVTETMRALNATELDLPMVGQVRLDEGKLVFVPWGC